MTEFDPEYVFSSFADLVPPGYVSHLFPIPFDQYLRFVWYYENGSAVKLTFEGQELIAQEFLFPWEARDEHGEPHRPSPETLEKLKSLLPPQLSREQIREE